MPTGVYPRIPGIHKGYGSRRRRSTTCRHCAAPLDVNTNWTESNRKHNNKVCSPCYRAYQNAHFAKHRERYCATRRRYHGDIRQEILEAYGRRCACCGESREEFLALDHVHNDGKHERAHTRSGTGFYFRVRKQGFPKDRYQLLCWNCNWAKAHGVCPHQTEPPATSFPWLTPKAA